MSFPKTGKQLEWKNETGEAQHEWLKETYGGVGELCSASEATSVSGNDRFSHLPPPKAVSNNLLITFLCSLLHSVVTSVWDCDTTMDRPQSSGRFRWAASPVSPSLKMTLMATLHKRLISHLFTNCILDGGINVRFNGSGTTYPGSGQTTDCIESYNW